MAAAISLRSGRRDAWRAPVTGRRTHGARAVVTGAGSGIGRAFAIELDRRGGAVVCADLDAAAAERTAASLALGRAAGCDVADLEQVEALATTAESWFGRPADLVVNNAGVGSGGRRVGDTPIDDWRRTLGVNLWGVVHGCHVFTPRLRAAGRGGIVNVASAASFAAAPGMAAYNVSKAGVLALSETLAAELSGTGIAVTAVCPTFVRTDIMGSDMIDAAAARLAEPLMRWTGWSPERIARTALDAHDRGRTHVVPQLDAQLIWRLKRLTPAAYTRALGLLGRLSPTPESGPPGAPAHDAPAHDNPVPEAGPSRTRTQQEA